jgi:hypothetical protein
MNTTITTPEELDAFVKQINERVIDAQHKHVEETLETLERRINDLRSSLKYAKQDSKECEVECNLGNIISAATTALARSPKTINAFEAYLAITGR